MLPEVEVGKADKLQHDVGVDMQTHEHGKDWREEQGRKGGKVAQADVKEEQWIPAERIEDRAEITRQPRRDCLEAIERGERQEVEHDGEGLEEGEDTERASKGGMRVGDAEEERDG